MAQASHSDRLQRADLSPDMLLTQVLGVTVVEWTDSGSYSPGFVYRDVYIDRARV